MTDRNSTSPNLTTQEPRNKKLTTTEFVRRAKLKHGERYDYSLVEYKNNKTSVTIACPKHGAYKQRPNNHLEGYGCHECGREANSGENERRRVEASLNFISKADRVHGQKYKYSKARYKNSKAKLVIGCPEHGEFTQTPDNHLTGRGCPKCKNDGLAGYNKTAFVKYASTKDGTARVYLIKCVSKTEKFYKIGITARTVSERFKQKCEMPYKYEVIKEIEGEAGFIYDIETKLHSMNKKSKYRPKKSFKGSARECFTEITQDTLFLLDAI